MGRGRRGYLSLLQLYDFIMSNILTLYSCLFIEKWPSCLRYGFFTVWWRSLGCRYFAGCMGLMSLQFRTVCRCDMGKQSAGSKPRWLWIVSLKWRLRLAFPRFFKPFIGPEDVNMQIERKNKLIACEFGMCRCCIVVQALTFNEGLSEVFII